MLIHGLQPVGYRSHALRIGTVATVSIRGYFSAMNEIQDGLATSHPVGPDPRNISETKA
jgi:hypothetical protein